MNPAIVFRQIKKHKDVFWVNFTGLTLAFVTAFFILAYVWNEFHYDRFHKNAGKIVRITENSNTGESSMIDARVSGGLAPLLEANFPEIESYNRLMPWRKAIVKIDHKTFYSKHVFSVDSGFFNFFSFRLLQGREEALFTNPGQVAISETMAQTYFGTTDVLGKRIQIQYQTEIKPAGFIIKGVFRDFPGNSHFKADLLCSYAHGHTPNWAYSYLLLSPRCDYRLLKTQIQNYMDASADGKKVKPVYNLQPLTDIHLHSHKSRELESNASIKSIFLLVSGALIILLIALINFTNLNYVRFAGNEKNYHIRKILGASETVLYFEFFQEVIILVILVIISGLAATHYFASAYGFAAFDRLPLTISILFVTSFAVLVLSFAIVPAFFSANKQRSGLFNGGKNVYNISLVIQLALSLMAVIASLVVQKQISYINVLHPQAVNSHIIVIPENSGIAVYKYHSFKENMLKHPEILSVTACSEPPAGIVTDNFKYVFDHRTADPHKTLNTLIIDTNFFSFFKIKPIAGSIDMTKAGSLQWERKVLKLWKYRSMNKDIPAGLKKEVAQYTDRYIINKSAMQLLGIQKPQDAIGRQFNIVHPMSELFPPGNITGVVDNFHYTNLFVSEKPLVMVCKNLFLLNFMVNFAPGESKEALAILEKEWGNVCRDIPLQFEFIDNVYHKVYKREYNEMKLLSLFSLISILLSLTGVFATLRYNLEKRTKETGIRKVNGATIFEIVTLFNFSLLKIFIMAFVLAAPVSWYIMQIWLQNFAYQTSISIWLFLEAGIFVLIIILITVSVQTWFVARRNPVDALRYE